jgi:hypothetical protein
MISTDKIPTEQELFRRAWALLKWGMDAREEDWTGIVEEAYQIQELGKGAPCEVLCKSVVMGVMDRLEKDYHQKHQRPRGTGASVRADIKPKKGGAEDSSPHIRR